LKLIDEAQKTAEGDVKSLLAEMRPTVESHLDHAKSVTRGLTFSAAIGGGPSVEEPRGTTPGAKHEGGTHREFVPKTDLKRIE
jgi:hypothetical protein